MQSFTNLRKVEVVDTPGIDEASKSGKAIKSQNNSAKADLILFVLDSDLTISEHDALQYLIQKGKPILLVLNRCDQW